jgi:isoquinoline 1-oxidoreductase alpha subunit
MPITLTINGQAQSLDLPGDMPLLWVLRDGLNLTGTKFGCGIASCGACTVHVNGQAARSCQVPLSDLQGATVTTIEDPSLRPLQQAWITAQVAQCGYCQSGQIMQAASLLATTPDPTDAEIDAAMEGNLCRCGTYPRIRAAIKDAAQQMKAL